jgi:hypothetical protein
MLELTLTNEQKVTVSLKPITASGKPAKLDGKPEWTVLSGPAAVTPAADGLSAVIESDDEDLTETVIQVDADADLGTGVEAISDTISVKTTHANAKNIGLVAGAPVDK